MTEDADTATEGPELNDVPGGGLPESVFDIAHLGRVELFTPDLKASTWYLRDLLGMEVVHADAGCTYLRGFGDYVTYTLKLSRA